MYQGIDGRVAIVTGGARGIGRATCELLLTLGASVVIADVSEEHGDTAQADLSALGSCIFVQADIASEPDVGRAVAMATARYGGVDILINNAAAFIMRGLEASTDDWRRMLDVNVMGYALCAKHAAPVMMSRGHGAIVNVSSMSGFIAQKGLLTYSTTKAAVTHLTRLMALELAPHIRVNAVCPGIVWTLSNAAVFQRTMGLDKAGADAHPDVGGKILLGRTAAPAEVAKAIVFLVSDDSSYITAENLVVDGGYTAVLACRSTCLFSHCPEGAFPFGGFPDLRAGCGRRFVDPGDPPAASNRS